MAAQAEYKAEAHDLLKIGSYMHHARLAGKVLRYRRVRCVYLWRFSFLINDVRLQCKWFRYLCPTSSLDHHRKFISLLLNRTCIRNPPCSTPWVLGAPPWAIGVTTSEEAGVGVRTHPSQPDNYRPTACSWGSSSLALSAYEPQALDPTHVNISSLA